MQALCYAAVHPLPWPVCLRANCIQFACCLCTQNITSTLVMLQMAACPHTEHTSGASVPIKSHKGGHLMVWMLELTIWGQDVSQVVSRFEGIGKLLQSYPLFPSQSRIAGQDGALPWAS